MGSHLLIKPESTVQRNGATSVPMVHDGKLLHKVGAAPSDQLVLTKPLGTGMLFAAHMQLAADGRDVGAALASMLQSNAAAAELVLTHAASACTDITGFGLLGHLLEMLDGGLGVTLELAALPLLPGSLALSRAGFVSTMHAANARSGGTCLYAGPTADAARLQMLFDPQTSGGLLIAVPGERATALCDALRKAGYVAAGIIGEVTALAPDGVVSVQVP